MMELIWICLGFIIPLWLFNIEPLKWEEERVRISTIIVMNLYDIWNNILLDYFFKDHHDEDIFLSVEYDELMNYAAKTGRFNEHITKINNKRVERGEERLSAEFLIQNLFKQAFCKEPLDASHFLHIIDEKVKSKSDNPQTMPLFALFMMPIANRPDLNSNNFYTKTTEFLRSKNIIRHNESISCSNFSSVGLSLRRMWEQLQNWAQRNDYNYHIKITFSGNRNAYVAPFLAEAVLSAVQRMLFKRVFYKAGLVVGQDISREKALEIIKCYGQIITFNDKAKLAQKLHDYEGALVDAFLQAYSKWDGTTIVETKCQSENGSQRSRFDEEGVVNRLYLSMSQSHGDYNFAIIANILNSESSESFEYTGEYGDYEFCIDINGIADETKRSEQIISAISNGDEIIFKNRNSSNDNLRYVPDDFILLESYFSRYISKVSVNKGGHYFALVRINETEKYTQWLAQNNARLCNNHNLKNGYFLYEIDSLQTGINGSLSLKMSSHKTSHLVSTLIVGEDNGVTLLYKGLPAYFSIEGVDLATNSVRAVFNSDDLIEEEPLQYIEELRMWKLPVISDSKKAEKAFVIYSGTEKLSPTTYKYSKCMFPQEYNEISYNEYGEYQTEQSVFNGLNISNDYKINVNLSSLISNMRQYGSEPNFTHFNYVNKDYLLYALSTHQRIDKKYIDNAINALVTNNLIEIKPGLTNRIIDNYCRMGYINYTYSDNKHIIAINRPTLIWLPPAYEAKPIVSSQKTVSANLTARNPTESFFKFLLTGARTPIFISNLINNAQKAGIILQIDEHKTPLYPQRIIIWSDNIETVRKFSEDNDIQFENCVYASSLLEKISDIEHYIDHITQKESEKDYGGIQNNFCGYDYAASNSSSFITHPKEINKESSLVTYFPGRYSKQTILWQKGHQYDIDLQWSYFVGMRLNKHIVAYYDKEQSIITMPIHIKLPMLYARALTMISGDIPSYVDNKRQYRVANNPYTKPVDGDEILKKLGQI